MLRSLLAASSLVLLTAASAGAQQSMAATPVVAAPAPAAAAPTRTIDTRYTASWNGVAVLSIKVNVAVNENGYSAKANMDPAGLSTMLGAGIRKSTTYAARANGVLDGPGAVHPDKYAHQGGKKRRLVQVDFTPDDVKTVASPAYGNMGEPPATRAQRVEAVDSLSGIVALVTAEPANVCNRTLKLYDGRSRFNLALSPLGKAKVETEGYKGDAIKCRADYSRVAGYSKPKPNEKTMFERPFTIWFAPASNGLLAPVKIVVESNYGPIAMNLEKMNAVTAR